MTEVASGTSTMALREKALGLLNNGLYEEAEPIVREVLEHTSGEKNEHGEVSAQVYLWNRRLAEILIGQGKYAEAEPLAKKTQKSFELRYGPADEDALDCKYLVAESLFGKGQLVEAATLAEEAVNGLQASRGPDHFTTLRCKALYALILQGQYKMMASKEVAQSVQDMLEAINEKVETRASMGGRRLSEAEVLSLRHLKAMTARALGLNAEKGGKDDPRGASKASTRAPDDDEAASRRSSKASKA